MSEVEKLRERLSTSKFHASWGPDANNLSTEERAAVLNSALDRVNAELSNTVEIPVVQLVDIADALHALSKLSKIDVRKFADISQAELDFKAKIREALGMTALFAEQWLPQDLQKERRKARIAAMENTGED